MGELKVQNATQNNILVSVTHHTGGKGPGPEYVAIKPGDVKTWHRDGWETVLVHYPDAPSSTDIFTIYPDAGNALTIQPKSG
jgi:hypothetical protein